MSQVKQNVIAVALTLGLLGAIGMQLWSSVKANQMSGPDHMAALDEDVYVHLNNTLYHISASGELVNQASFSELGIPGILADMQVLSDGTVLLGSLKDRKIYQCKIDVQECEIIGPSESKAIANKFSFFLHEPSKQLYIADNGRHRLLVQDMENRGIREVVNGRTLRCPNDIWVGEDGLLRVADTNHHRIVTFRIDGFDVEEVEPSMQGRSDLVRVGHTWPVALVPGDNGEWWVLNADGMMEDPDLIVYDQEGQPLKKIELPPHGEIFAIARTANQFLLTDLALAEVYTLSSPFDSIQPFGDSAFQAILTEFRNQKESYRKKSRDYLMTALLIFSITMIFGVRVFMTSGERQGYRKARTYEPIPISRFTNVHWLEPDGAVLKQMKRISWILALSSFCLPLMAFIPIVENLKKGETMAPEELVVVATLLIIPIIAIALGIHAVRRMLRHRIGYSGKMLYLGNHRGMALEVPPEELVYTERQAACGPIIVPLRMSHMGRHFFTPLPLNRKSGPDSHRRKRSGKST